MCGKQYIKKIYMNQRLFNKNLKGPLRDFSRVFKPIIGHLTNNRSRKLKFSNKEGKTQAEIRMF